jgi:F0F1-type ATP synthase assembly protein I
MRQFALATEAPFLLVATVVIGGGLGFLLDRRLHTKPWIMLALGAAGFIVGMWDMLRRLSRDDGR